MKTYKVYGHEKVFYGEMEIETENEQEAREKYEALISSGEILPDDGQDFQVEIELV